MTSTHKRVCTLLVEIQDAFIHTPDLRLSPAEVERRFGADTVTCDAILGVLVDASVLMQTPSGAYASAGAQTHPPHQPQSLEHVSDAGDRSARLH